MLSSCYLTKAFDTPNHDLLIAKLKAYRLSVNSLISLDIFAALKPTFRNNRCK